MIESKKEGAGPQGLAPSLFRLSTLGFGGWRGAVCRAGAPRTESLHQSGLSKCQHPPGQQGRRGTTNRPCRPRRITSKISPGG